MGHSSLECGKATCMAKALRDRGGKRYKGTQGTRKLYTMDVVGILGEMEVTINAPYLVSRVR